MAPRLLTALGAGSLTALAACSSPDLSGATFSCSTSADCLDSEVCLLEAETPACVPAADHPIKIGMSGPLQGPSADLGNEMRRGISVMFAAQNAAGGVHGRPLELVTQNDSYDPTAAVQAMHTLLDIRETTPNPDAPDVRGPNGVFALLGNIGTPTMLETAPLATKNQVVFFAPFTGAQQYLRDGTNSPYVYNYRAGYFEEAQAMIDYLATSRTPRVISEPPGDSYRRVIVFQQDDSYGDSGYEGIRNAYNRISPLPSSDAIRRIRYQRDRVESVDEPVAEAKALLTELLEEAGGGPISVAFVMIDTYRPGNKFIRALKDWMHTDAELAQNLDVVFMHVSFVGSDSLSDELRAPPETHVDATSASGGRKSYTEDVMVMQVVPYYGSQAPAVTDYRRHLAEYEGGEETFTSLEGYIVARLFVRALELTGRDLDTERFRSVLDTQIRDLDIGIGPLLSFTPENRQASHTVWGSSLEADGTFSVPFIWDPGSRIRPN